MNASSSSVLRDLGATFVSGAAAGCLLMGGIKLFDLDVARALLDVSGDGIDLRDTGAVSWIFGQMAILIRFVVPGLLHL